MNQIWDIIEQYRENAAYVTIKGAIINPQSGVRAPFRFECMVDTGFTSGLYSEEGLRSDAEIVGVTPVPTEIRLGDGTKVPAYACVAHIEEINKHKLQPPGLKVTMLMRGTRKGYLGMEALKSWVILFDGPDQRFKLGFKK